MSEQKNGKRIVEIKENPAANVPAQTPDTNGQQNNAAEVTEKISFWKHPIKWTKNQFKEHPVASTAVAVGGVGLLGFGVKCLADALGGEDRSDDEDDDVLDDVLDDEEDDDEEI